MKFQQLSAFEKHLEKASPDHLSRVYLVVAPCPFERKRICERICGAIQKKEQKISVLTFDAVEGWAKACEELDTICFLSGHRIVILDEADKLKKSSLEALTAYLAKPSPYIYLILSASAAKHFSHMYEQGKKELIVCDLSAEKPWERERRLKDQLLKMAASEKKVLTREAADMLLERIGTDLAQLELEMSKLFCYCLDRPQIAVEDVQTLCHAERSASIWKMAEAIVWQEKTVSMDDAAWELSSFLPLLGNVRSHVQQGMQFAVHLEEGKPVHEISLPFFKPQLLEKITPIVRERGTAFFKKALAVVFEIEMLAKNSGLSPSLLLDLLAAKMHKLKR